MRFDDGVAIAGPGVSIEDLWRGGLPRGLWPPVVSGTMRPTVAGALAMNIHGKNAFQAGTFGEHIRSLSVMLANGDVRTLTRDDPEFSTVIGGAGLFGAVVEAEIAMRDETEGHLYVRAIPVADWDGHFQCFETAADGADYMVSWIDGWRNGRGLFHSASYGGKEIPRAAQELPDRILGVLPKSATWRFLRPFTNDFGMRCLNRAKALSNRDHVFTQSLVAFNFLLDYVPNWQRAYAHGMFQFQAFIPAALAPAVFPRLVEACHARSHPPYLLVMKRHRSDPFFLSPSVDGYSLAMDFPYRSDEDAQALTDHLAELVLAAKGRFYLAKDRFLRAEHFLASLPDGHLGHLRNLKARMDPEHRFTSDLARRLRLFET
jgi:decaprenylphospho-beta-D-ribofuranose 2-oxidase